MTFYLWKMTDEIAGSESGSVSKRYGSADPDPYQKDTDTQHRKKNKKVQTILPDPSVSWAPALPGPAPWFGSSPSCWRAHPFFNYFPNQILYFFLSATAQNALKEAKIYRIVHLIEGSETCFCTSYMRFYKFQEGVMRNFIWHSIIFLTDPVRMRLFYMQNINK